MIDPAALTSGALALLVYYNALEADFVYDDTRAILQNPDMLPSMPINTVFQNDFWGTPLSHTGSHKSYRPLTTLTFRLNHIVSANNDQDSLRFHPWGFHATNVALHALATYLLVVYTRNLLQATSNNSHSSLRNKTIGKSAASMTSLAVWTTGILFALHPVHVEAVTGIVGRADILAGIFFLLALLFHQKHYSFEQQRSETDFKCDKNQNVNYNHHGSIMMVASKETENNNNHTCSPITSHHHKYNEPCLNGSKTDGNKCGANNNHLVEIYNHQNGKKLTGCINQLPYLAWTCMFAACSMFSKEHGITVLGVCIIVEIVQPYRKVTQEPRDAKTKQNLKEFSGSYKSQCDKRRFSVFCLTLSTIILIFLRLYLMGGFRGAPSFASADNPAASQESFITRTLTFAYLPPFNLVHLLLCPNRLSFDWSMEAIPLITSIFDMRNITTIAIYSVLGFLIFKAIKESCSTNLVGLMLGVKIWNSENTFNAKSNSVGAVISICLAIIILPFIPATNIFFYVGFVAAERILYIPSMGYCVLVGCGLSRLWKATCYVFVSRGVCEKHDAKRRLMEKVYKFCFIVLTCVIFTSFSLKTINRNGDWLNEERLYRSGVEINPPKALGNLGNVLTHKGMLTEAEKVFNKALKFRPNMADVHYNLGVLLQRQNRLLEAMECYKRAIHFRPKLVLAHLNLGMTYDALGHKKDGLRILRAIASIPDGGLKDPRSHKNTQTSALFNSGKLLLELGYPEEAMANLQEVHTILLKEYKKGMKGNLSGNLPSLQAVLNLLGEANRSLNKTQDAERYYRAALEVKPDHIPAYLTYGKLLAKNKTRHVEAERWFSKANQLAPSDPSVHLHYGLFLMDAEGDRNFEAGQKFQTAAELILREQSNNFRFTEVSGSLQDSTTNSGVSVYDSVFNAAVAYRQAGRHDLAEIFYRKAVTIRPKDPSSHMNLGAMLHLVGKLRDAEEEYLNAWKLATSHSKNGKALDKPDYNEQLASQNTIRINLKRLHNIMQNKGLKIKKANGIDN